VSHFGGNLLQAAVSIRASRSDLLKLPNDGYRQPDDLFSAGDGIKYSWIYNSTSLRRRQSKPPDCIGDFMTSLAATQAIIPQAISDCKKWKLWNISSLQASNSAPTSGNSLVVRRVSPGRIIILLFWTKSVAAHKIKARILKLTIRGGQSNISVVFTCASSAENDSYRVVSEGPLGFDCRSYCKRCCRMQGTPCMTDHESMKKYDKVLQNQGTLKMFGKGAHIHLIKCQRNHGNQTFSF